MMMSGLASQCINKNEAISVQRNRLTPTLFSYLGYINATIRLHFRLFLSW